MDFKLSEDQTRLRDTARRFATEKMGDVAAALERDNVALPEEWRRRYAEMGFLGVNVAERFGGLGLGNVEALLVIEEFAKVSPAVAFPIFESCVGPARAIERFADPALAERVLPKVCAGEIVVAVAMSEPEAGSALTDLRTKAAEEGDGYVIHGQKRWCSGAGHADAYVVYCRMSEAPGAKGIGAVYVEADASGLSFGAQEQLMGFRGIPSSDMVFDGARIPRENVIVPAGGFPKLMQAFDLERCGNATMCLGLAAAAQEAALAYVQERRQFGKPLIDFQAVQLKLAEVAMRTEAARLLIHRAAQNAEDGFPSVFESSVAKCFANEMAREVCGETLQLMGAYGYSKEFPMERRLRDAWGWGIAGGAVDIQKINIAAAMAERRFDQRR